jgi:hypothetical protein
VLPAAATVVTATALAAPAVLPPGLATALVTALPLHVPGGGAIGLARLGDSREHGEHAAKSQTTNQDSNDLVHLGLHSHGLTSAGPGHVSPHRVTTG